MSDRRPHLLFILVDDLGHGDISAHGGPNVQTQHIDRLGAAGLRFTRCYANSPVCSPSRAALLTGRYPDMVGVPGVIRSDPDLPETGRQSWGYFDPAAITLPDLLGPAGYHCHHVGKWHLGLEPENHPCRRGFHGFRGFLGDMMDDYWTHRRFGQNYLRDGYETIDPEGHATDLFTDWAIEYLHERAERSDAPFFCYLAYNAPHTPIQPPEEWVERIRAREGDVLDEKRLRYVALVEHLDAGIGRVLDALEATGLADDTLVVFASDNGGWLPAGACNLPLRGGKLDMYEGGIRVPCCARWPGRIDPGRESDLVCLLMDFFPTLCAAAGVPVGHAIEGRSILPELTGEGDVDFAGRDYYWVRREGWGLHGPGGTRRYLGNDYHALRRGDLKLLHNHAFAPLELFDLAADPGEEAGLDVETHPDAPDLAERMQERIRLAGAVPWQKPTP